jgi:hypothetical protein
MRTKYGELFQPQTDDVNMCEHKDALYTGDSTDSTEFRGLQA